MSHTQNEINSLLAQFMQSTVGQRVDYYGYTGECLSLAKRWVDVVRNGSLNGPMAAPPAVEWGSDYFRVPPAQILELFEVQGHDPNRQYPRGSMFVNMRTHHIGILLDNQPSNPNAVVYQQNANPDGSPAHEGLRSKANIDGILVIKLAPDAPAEPLYTITLLSSPKPVKVVPGHYKWNLARADFNDVAANPITTSDDNTVFSAVAVLHHREIPQYNYYLEDANTPHGWNVLDCVDYIAPPKPYVPPAPPIAAKPVEYYDLLTTVAYFDSAPGAKTDTNAKGTLEEGKYVLLDSDGTARKLTKNNQDVQTFWINDYDNKKPYVATVPSQPVDIVKPVLEPTDVSNNSASQASAKPQYEMIHPVMLKATNTTPQVFPDLEHPNNVVKAQLNPGSIKEYSMVAWIGSDEYYIPTLSMKKGWRHGIPVRYLGAVKRAKRANFLDYNDDGKVDFSDLSGFIQTPAKLYDTFKPVLTKGNNFLKANGKQLIDGFTRRKP